MLRWSRRLSGTSRTLCATTSRSSSRHRCTAGAVHFVVWKTGLQIRCTCNSFSGNILGRYVFNFVPNCPRQICQKLSKFVELSNPVKQSTNILPKICYILASSWQSFGHVAEEFNCCPRVVDYFIDCLTHLRREMERRFIFQHLINQRGHLWRNRTCFDDGHTRHDRRIYDRITSLH